jgi:hypothetical protein
MAARTATTRLDGTRLWSSVLAAIISLALVASLFHCCCFDSDGATLTVSVAQIGGEESGKTAPCSTTAHCCHCLAHVTTVAPQDNIASTQYVMRLDRLAAAPAPDAADLDSPFKPPRA